MNIRCASAAAILGAGLLAAPGLPAQDLGGNTAAHTTHATPMTSAAAKGQSSGHDMAGHGQHGKPDSPSMQMHHTMMRHDMDAMKMTGDADRDFASMMIMHHEQGIRMMDIELKHGKNAALKAMAQKMKAQQAKEIAELRKFR